MRAALNDSGLVLSAFTTLSSGAFESRFTVTTRLPLDGASKAAIVNATKSFAAQLGPHRVLINAVAPGLTRTQMFDALPQSRKDAMERSSYCGRAARVDEVSQAIVWLGTSSPEYVNGTVLDVNCGFYPR